MTNSDSIANKMQFAKKRRLWPDPSLEGGGASDNCGIKSANKKSKYLRKVMFRKSAVLLLVVIMCHNLQSVFGDTGVVHDVHSDNVNPYNQEAPPGTPDADTIAYTLKERGFVGGIYPKHSYGYENFRKVRNGACNHRYPRVIIRPSSTYDVSVAVKVAKELKLPVSVRSGGHSYTCMSIRHDSLHFDMRRLNKVQLLPREYGEVSYLKLFRQHEPHKTQNPTISPPQPLPTFYLG